MSENADAQQYVDPNIVKICRASLQREGYLVDYLAWMKNFLSGLLSKKKIVFLQLV